MCIEVGVKGVGMFFSMCMCVKMVCMCVMLGVRTCICVKIRPVTLVEKATLIIGMHQTVN